MMQHRDKIVGDPIVISDRATEKQDRAIREQRISRRNAAAAAVHADDKAPWFVFRVMYGRELAVENELRKAGIECLVPMRKGRWLRRRGRQTQPIIPVMVGYVLVRFEVSVDAIMGIMNFEHVAGIVGGAATPRYVSHWEVERFCEMARNGQFDWSTASAGIKRDCKVEVAHGPFKGANGVVVSCRSDGLGDAVVEFDSKGVTFSALLPLAIIRKL